MENKEEAFTSAIPKQPVNHKRRLSFTISHKTKKVILLLGGISAIVLFFYLPANKVWLKDRIINYWSDFRNQRKQLSLEQRKISRFNSQYTYSKCIADLFRNKSNTKDILVLMPPAGYFKKHGISYKVPRPSIFYYFTGLKTVWPGSSDAADANWYVRVYGKQIIVDSVTNVNTLMDTITAFKKW